MTAPGYLKWMASALFGFVLMLALRRLSDKVKKQWIRVLIFFVKFFGMTVLALRLIAFASPFLWKYSYPLLGIYVALLADCMTDVIAAVCALFKKERTTGRTFRTSVLSALTLVLFAYGTINSAVIRQDRLQFRSDKIKEPHMFVFLADLHYGSSQTRNTVEKALKEIKALHPDFVILGGDICDEHTEKEEMEWIFRQFGSLETPVYYIYGNHDRQERGDYIGGKKYSEKEIADAISDSGITILPDDAAVIGDDLVLLGREDVSHESRKAVKDLPELPAGAFVICADHTPYQNEDILETGADLQLSGHTHAGQYFPVKHIYRLLGLNVYGTYTIGNTELYVSPGIAGWYMPFRNEAHCSYAVVELMPE